MPDFGGKVTIQMAFFSDFCTIFFTLCLVIFFGVKTPVPGPDGHNLLKYTIMRALECQN